MADIGSELGEKGLRPSFFEIIARDIKMIKKLGEREIGELERLLGKSLTDAEQAV
jgi:hypothetical protein